MTTSASPNAVPAGATPSAPWPTSSSAQPSALPQQLHIGQGRPEDTSGFPLAGGVFLLALIVLAIVLRLRVGQHRSSSANLGAAWLGGWRRLLGPQGDRGGRSSGGAGIAVECQVRIDPATQLHVVRWEGGRLLLATTSNGVTLVDRTDGPAESGGATS